MGVPYRYAMNFMGRPVVAHCCDGRRYVGIVRRVTPNMMWIEMAGPRVMPIQGTSEPMISTADRINEKEILDIETAGVPFRPFFRDRVIALVLFDLLAISLFAW